MLSVTLETHVCAARHSYKVTFEGPEAEATALAFIDGRSSTHAFAELDDKPLDYEQFPLLYEVLYPTCEHGMSLDLCYGPAHYATDEEIAQGF